MLCNELKVLLSHPLAATKQTAQWYGCLYDLDLSLQQDVFITVNHAMLKDTEQFCM